MSKLVEDVDHERRLFIGTAAMGIAAAAGALLCLSIWPQLTRANTRTREPRQWPQPELTPSALSASAYPRSNSKICARRLAATRWPERETVGDDSQGVPLAMMQDLVHYWQADYDWRKAEAKLNALPQFMTEIDGLDIHFIHVRSKHDNAMPLIVTHGWPGSVIEQLKISIP